MLTSTGARKQPLVIHITTSDYDRESICNEKYAYAVKVRDGIIDDPSFLPVIYEASREDDWTHPDTWRKANPGLGESVFLEYLEREGKRAEDSPSYENTFKRLHLNIRTEQDTRWIPMVKWDACAEVEYEPEQLKGEKFYAGLDLASTTDIAALVLVFPNEAGYAALPFFWIPGDSAHERERRDRVPYLTWARQGLIFLTDGDVIDYDAIRMKINELQKVYNIQEIAIDRWNVTQITSQLTGDGFELIGFGQGYASMSAPSKELEKLVLGQQLAHGGHPVMRWMESNVAIEMDSAGNVKPSKKRSSDEDRRYRSRLPTTRPLTLPCGMRSHWRQPWRPT